MYQRGRIRQRGMVTVEIAFAALGLGLALVFCVGVIGLGLGQLRCSDAAGEIARQAARDDLEAIHEIIQRLPESASVDIGLDGDHVVVEVSIDLRPWGKWLPCVQVHATASVAHEKGGG